MGSSRFFPVLIFLVTLVLGISASPVLTERATTPKCTANDIALVRRTVNDEVYFCKWWLSDGRTRSPFYQFTPIQVTNLCKCIVAGSKTASKPKRDESRDVFVFEEFIEVFKLVAVKDILKDVLQDIFANIVKVFDQNLIFIQNHVEIFLQAPDNFVFVQNLFEDNLKVFVYNFHELVQVFVVPYIFVIVVSYIFVIVDPYTLSISPYIFFVGWLILVISLVLHFD
ncbi:hypothetical protein D6C88_09725 [Aureobasidium pullulans]|nr:hypothetical protein D6C88_09725 [Aureobasidium pullulans]